MSIPMKQIPMDGYLQIIHDMHKDAKAKKGKFMFIKVKTMLGDSGLIANEFYNVAFVTRIYKDTLHPTCAVRINFQGGHVIQVENTIEDLIEQINRATR